jgi:glycerophosphoryl diester phosphodiesterase
MKYFIIVIALVFFTSCRRTFEAPVPSTTWDLFQSASARPLDSTARSRLEGVYVINNAADVFGPQAVLKWTYTALGKDTTYHLSIFCEKDVSYFICEGRRLDSVILLNGYWRKMTGTATGKARFTVTPANGSTQLLDSLFFNPGNLTITGTFGNGEDIPAQSITLKYNRPLYKSTPLEIVAHRLGGRTSDLSPASENTVEILRMASSFGATGVETDVRMTKDGVPVIFHDATLNERLIQKNGMVGPIENFTYTQLYDLVRLEHGEHIPTLEQVLNTLVTSTPLRFIWLDTKFSGNLQPLRDLQKKYMQLATSLGKQVLICIGIPDNGVLDNFLKLPDYQVTPAVCELDIPYVEKSNARVWGPRWTLGLQTDKVEQMHAEGRRAFVWTLDVPENIVEYMNQGKWDGILSNYPSAVAYYYYAKQ